MRKPQLLFVMSLLFSGAVFGGWLSAITPDSASLERQTPVIAASGSDVYIAYMRYDKSSYMYDAYLIASHDGGLSWSSPARLDKDYSEKQSLAIGVNGDKVYVAYSKFSGGVFNIFAVMSRDKGNSWGAPARVAQSASYQDHPSIEFVGNVACVVYKKETEIYATKSDAEGLNWVSANKVDEIDNYEESPDTASSGNALYVGFWAVEREADGQSYNSYLVKSLDGGASWTAQKRIDATLGDERRVVLAASGSNVYAAYEKYTKNYDIYFIRSTDNGGVWEAPIKLDNDTREKKLPVISASGQNVYVLYQKYTQITGGGLYDLYMVMSTDYGKTWSAPERIDPSTGGEKEQGISASGGNVYLVYQKFKAGFYDVYSKTGMNIGGAEQQKEETKNGGAMACIQVIAPAVSPDGECVEYSAPCDVPKGWVIVESCAKNEEEKAKKEEEQLCVQVVTSAVSPEGKCIEYPTPCDVPSGWVNVGTCELPGSAGGICGDGICVGLEMVDCPSDCGGEIRALETQVLLKNGALVLLALALGVALFKGYENLSRIRQKKRKMTPRRHWLKKPI